MRVLHLIDATDSEELQLALQPLIERLPAERCLQHVLLASGPRSSFPYLTSNVIGRLSYPGGRDFLATWQVQRCVAEQGIDVVHAWSLDLAYLAALALRGRAPVVWTQYGADLSERACRQLAALRREERVSGLCHAAMVRRRLVERGLPMERCAVVRPGVDFATINRMRRDEGLRDQLRLGSEHRVVLLNGLRSAGDDIEGYWIAEIAARCLPELLLVVPGTRQRLARIVRYRRRCPETMAARLTAARWSLPQLLGVADAMLVTVRGDISGTAIAWAMAAGVPIVAFADYCVAEFISDGLNGHLVKPGLPATMAAKLRDVLLHRDDHVAIYDRARAQAYESFGMSRYVEQVHHAYRCVIEGNTVGTELTDAAMDV